MVTATKQRRRCHGLGRIHIRVRARSLPPVRNSKRQTVLPSFQALLSVLLGMLTRITPAGGIRSTAKWALKHDVVGQSM